jgi:glutathione S-transferase
MRQATRAGDAPPGEEDMKFYNSIGPNPRMVRIFMAEKGIDLPKVEIDLKGAENRREPYLSKNPAGQLPCLELDDGSYLAEITAICEYLDEKFPGPSLLGATAEQRAETRMWCRRIDLNIVEPMGMGFRSSDGLDMFKDRIHCIPQAAADMKQIVQEKYSWLDRLMQGKTYVCGERFTMADILLFAFVEFGNRIGQKLSAECAALTAWHARMKARPSATA